MESKEFTKDEIDKLKRNIRACDQNKPYVFISYSSEDKVSVYKDVIELQKRGINIWIDKELENYLGENWKRHAFKAMANRNCKMVLYYISMDSIVSP